VPNDIADIHSGKSVRYITGMPIDPKRVYLNFSMLHATDKSVGSALSGGSVVGGNYKKGQFGKSIVGYIGALQRTTVFISMVVILRL
jgi:hypothetical protein